MFKKVYIIAEAGVNHNGSIDTAKMLVDVASESGADAVKFQTFKAKNLVTKNAIRAKYQDINTGNKDSQYDMLKKLELNKEMHHELIEYCKSKNLTFLSSPFDHESIILLDNLGLKIFKIPSGEITNLPYLQHVGKLNKKVILSTGMSTIEEIEKALYIITQSGTKKDNITLLHANSEYPTPMEDVNLRAMLTIGNKFDISYGYSDHTTGIEISIAAVAMGARCIEKHITLDRNMEGPDHKASIEPDELSDMIDAIRNVEKALGSDIKQPSKSESSNIKIVRKSIVAKIPIKKGDVLSEKNLTIKRPGSGISPMKWDEIIGTKAKKNYEEEELI